MPIVAGRYSVQAKELQHENNPFKLIALNPSAEKTKELGLQYVLGMAENPKDEGKQIILTLSVTIIGMRMTNTD